MPLNFASDELMGRGTLGLGVFLGAVVVLIWLQQALTWYYILQRPELAVVEKQRKKKWPLCGRVYNPTPKPMPKPKPKPKPNFSPYPDPNPNQVRPRVQHDEPAQPRQLLQPFPRALRVPAVRCRALPPACSLGGRGARRPQPTLGPTAHMQPTHSPILPLHCLTLPRTKQARDEERPLAAWLRRVLPEFLVNDDTRRLGLG